MNTAFSSTVQWGEGVSNVHLPSCILPTSSSPDSMEGPGPERRLPEVLQVVHRPVNKNCHSCGKEFCYFHSAGLLRGCIDDLQCPCVFILVFLYRCPLEKIIIEKSTYRKL